VSYQGARHSEVVKCIRQYLDVRGAWSMKVLGGMGQRRGVPDILAVMQGRMIAVEVKTGAAVLSRWQLFERQGLEAAGAVYILASTVEHVEDALLAAGLIESAAIMRFGKVGT